MIDVGKDINTLASSLLDVLNKAAAGDTDDLMCTIEEVLDHG